MFVFNKNFWRKLSLYVSLGIEKIVGGENGRSEEAASILVLQLCVQLLSNDAYLHWKQCKWIFSLFWPMHHSNPPPSKDMTSATSWSTWVLNLKYSPMNISLFTLLGTIIWNSQHIQLPKIPILCTPCQNATLLFDGSMFYPWFEILLLWIFFFTLVGVIIQKS